MFETFIIYNYVLLFGVLFAWLSERTDQLKNTFLFLSFIVIFSISFLRFNVGHDYYNYVISFKNIYNQSGFSFTDKYTYKLICKIFSFSPRGYILVFGFYSLVTLLFLFKTLLSRNILSLGLFIFICYNYLFTSFDQIRQTAAVAVFLYSIEYIEKRNFPRFLLTLLIAGFFHFSALFLIPFYFLSRVKIKFQVWIILILIFIIGYFTGFWESLRLKFFNLIPVYSFYAEMEDQLVSKELGTGLGFIYLIIIIILILWHLKDADNPVLYTLTGFGIIVFLFSAGNLNLDRFANYFLMSQCISIPLILKKVNNQILTYFILISAFLMFQVYIIQSPRGTSPYQSVFSRNYKKEILFFRE